MKKQNILVVTLLITVFLINSMFSVIAIDIGPTNVDSLVVVKEVYNGVAWVDSINANISDIVTFRITVTYYNITDPSEYHYATNIIVNDTLPSGLDYVSGSADPFEPTVNGKILTWNLGSTILYHGDSYVIIFNATVFASGQNVNLASAVAYEYCLERYISDSDTAFVKVIVLPPDIDVEKYVWDGFCFWVKETSKYKGETVTFKIVVKNTGGSNLYNILTKDTLSDSLEYNVGSATLNGDTYEPVINGKNLTWTWNVLASEETLEIIFNATIVGLPCDVDTNFVYVEGTDLFNAVVMDWDSVEIHIKGMCMSKEVWDKDHNEWMESTHASIGETVRFRITIYYYGAKILYNIKVTDILPECFSYADNAIPEEPVVTDGMLFWDLSDSKYDLTDGETLIIEFDAVVEGGMCDECINWAYVTANECSGRIFQWQDSARVYVECDYTADAGGPYYGDIDEEIEITGSAADGNPPYLFQWDLDDDGKFNNAVGPIITHSWSESGSYIIRLKVTDKDYKTAEDYAVVIIAQDENNPPNKPSKPSGISTGSVGKTYTYISNAIDPDGDKVMYLFDWDDGTNSSWLGPFNSGEIVDADHKWTTKGSFSVKVKAKDVHNAETVWSDPLSITMPKIQSYNLIIQQLFKILERFSFL
jgi:uncharacterized repeat protein (TIGR01451 family)/fimbrial isopeptide formation D2 family protein